MNDTTVTVVGIVCSEIRYGQSTDNNPIARFQIRNTPRRYDKRTGTWTEGDPNYFSAVCWRTLADHVASSMVVGDPVVATGRLRISRWRRGEENVVTAELDVQAIGHDLRWGTTVYRKSAPPGGTRVPGPGQRRRPEAAEPQAVGVSAAAADQLEVSSEAANAESATAQATAPTTAPTTAQSTAQTEVMELPAAA